MVRAWYQGKTSRVESRVAHPHVKVQGMLQLWQTGPHCHSCLPEQLDNLTNMTSNMSSGPLCSSNRVNFSFDFFQKNLTYPLSHVENNWRSHGI